MLVRLSSYALEEFEYAVDAEEAFEGWRFVVEYSAMWVCWRGWRYDMPMSGKEVEADCIRPATRTRKDSSMRSCAYGQSLSALWKHGLEAVRLASASAFEEGPREYDMARGRNDDES